ncbi:MAG: hypothetical protein KatS3mg102_2389 [Planctomycetota bacterium]|nr:MAG: hypothetical protein KatS3mg102_2389 [Planctomycetota bacterium]
MFGQGGRLARNWTWFCLASLLAGGVHARAQQAQLVLASASAQRTAPAATSRNTADAPPAGATAAPHRPQAAPGEQALVAARRGPLGVGGRELVRTLQARLAREEALLAAATSARAEQERMLQALVREIDGVGTAARSEGPVADPPETLLGCWRLPAAREHAPVRFCGVHRYAYRHLRRKVESLWRDELEERYRLDPQMRVGAYHDALQAEEEYDANRLARFSSPFPTYWRGHPEQLALDAEELVIGEEIELLRLGGLSVRNDVKMRYNADDAPVLLGSEGDDELHGAPAEQTASQLTARRPHQHRPAHARGAFDRPDGNLYSNSWFSADGRIDLRLGLSSALPLRKVKSQLELKFYDSYDHAELAELELELELQPRGTAEVSLALRLVKF